jgi:monoamine oxidase
LSSAPFLPRRRRLLAGAALAGLAGACERHPPAADVERVLAGLQGRFVGADATRGHRLREAPRWQDADAAESVGVLIVGGGVAGLAALRALARAGIDDVKLIELEDVAGGNARAGRLGGIDCPLGAHYLPLPDERNEALLDFLGELDLWHWQGGKRTWRERDLCHSPQERLFFEGSWTEGLLPPLDAAPGLREALRQMARLVAEAGRAAAWRIPTRLAPWSPALAALDASTFDAWLDTQQVRHPLLRAHLDYCCRDDYGASSAQVSAWAGLHYFAARHGFTSGEELTSATDTDPVLTWPEGNAWLSQRLAAPRGARIETGTVALALRETRAGIEALVRSAASDRLRRIRARQVILAVPLFVADRLVEQPPAALRSAVGAMQWAPWLVSNLLLDAPLADGPGAAPAWDNVIAASPALGYVDATHQALDPRRGVTVLTHYWALGGRSAAELAAGRARLLGADWRDWARDVLLDLARAQPDVVGKVRGIELARYGHAMSVPGVGVRGSAALAALSAPAPSGQRVHFAHADLSAYSVFEEAFFHGERAAADVARLLEPGTVHLPAILDGSAPIPVHVAP